MKCKEFNLETAVYLFSLAQAKPEELRDSLEEACYTNDSECDLDEDRTNAELANLGRSALEYQQHLRNCRRHYDLFFEHVSKSRAINEDEFDIVLEGLGKIMNYVDNLGM